MRQQPGAWEETYRSGQRSLCHIPAAGVAVAARSLTGSVPWSTLFAHARLGTGGEGVGGGMRVRVRVLGTGNMHEQTDRYDTMLASVRASIGGALWDSN